MDQAGGLQLLDTPDVDVTPYALRLARREAHRPGIVAASGDAVDPAEAQRPVEGLLVGEGRLPGFHLVEAQHDLPRLVVIPFEPRPERLLRGKETRRAHLRHSPATSGSRSCAACDGANAAKRSGARRP